MTTARTACLFLLPLCFTQAKGEKPEGDDKAGDAADNPPKDEQEGEVEPPDEAAQEQATDDLALTIIMGIVSNRRLPAPPEEPQPDRRDERRSSHRGEAARALWGLCCLRIRWRYVLIS